MEAYIRKSKIYKAQNKFPEVSAHSNTHIWGPAFCSVSTRLIREDNFSVPREKTYIDFY